MFHTEPDEVSAKAVQDRLLAAVATEEGPVRLLGAHLGSLSIDYAILDGPSNHPIDLREAEIDGELSARYVTVERPLRLDGACLRSFVDFEDATFHAAADFLNTYFADVANFYRATFDRGAVFDSSTFEANAQFYDASIDAPAIKLDSVSGSPRSERERRDGIALSLDGVTCERDLRLTGATLGGDVALIDSDLGRDLECGDVSTSGNVIVDCSRTATISGVVAGSDGNVEYEFGGATVGELDVTDDATFDVFRFSQTTFSGFDFGAYKHDLAARDWRLHDSGTDTPPEELENLYLRAKNGANEIGDTRASAEFFIHEMVYRRAGHRERVLTGDGIGQRIRGGLILSAVTRWRYSTPRGGEFLHELTADSINWLSNAALQVSCGYGERPLRPVLFSVVLILAFAGVYAGLDAPIRYAEPIGYLTLSVEGFVSIILGLPEITGSTLSLVVALQGFFGGFVIALFVFTLTRSISR